MKKNKRSFNDLQKLNFEYQTETLFDDFLKKENVIINWDIKEYCETIRNTLIKFGFIEKDKLISNIDLILYFNELIEEDEDSIYSLISDVLHQNKYLRKM